MAQRYAIENHPVDWRAILLGTGLAWRIDPTIPASSNGARDKKTNSARAMMTANDNRRRAQTSIRKQQRKGKNIH